MIKNAVFFTSVASEDRIPSGDVPEIAVAGKSNVGKSSFINCLTQRNKLAKASSEPGRTRLINYFAINGSCYFVDLPGYGFARVSDAEKDKWSDLIEGYLLNSRELRNVFVIMDVRHPAGELDKVMIEFLNHYRIGFTVIATKIDKVKKSQLPRYIKALSESLMIPSANIYPVSSESKEGREKVLDRLDDLLALPPRQI